MNNIPNLQNQIDGITILPDYLSDNLVLQGEIEYLSMRVEEIDEISMNSLQGRIAALE
jgi:hypothetical protein